MEKGNRIDWIDYYKALAIILVVLGHTGQFGLYIYQFHIAAFFFISGVVAGLEKKKLDEVIILKFFSLMLPYMFFATCGFTIFAVLQKFGVLKYVSMYDSIPGLASNLIHMFSSGYCDWLGAMWFLKTLFVVTVISKLCLMADGNKCGIIFVASFMFLFLMGYFYHENGYSPVFINSFDHFLIVQGFFSMGILYRWIADRIGQKIPKIIIPIAGIASFVGIGFIKSRYITMDLAVTHVNTPATDLLIAGNGIVFLLCLSMLISFIPSARIKGLVSYLGRKTFGPLIFHFVGYKVVTLILSIFGICEWTEISKLVPPEEITRIWWPLYLAGSIAFSLAVWALINKSRVIRFLTGSERNSYKKIYNRYTELYSNEQL